MMKNTDLIIFSGQSNMEGEAERMPEDNSPVEGALEYRFLEDKLVPLRHPAGENISNNGILHGSQKGTSPSSPISFFVNLLPQWGQ